MQFIRDKLTYEEVRQRFEKEGYALLSTEYKNAKGSLRVQCPRGHGWSTSISNFDSGRRCSVCSKKKKYTLEEVKYIFANKGYQVEDSIYINGKTSMKIFCPERHEINMCLNNFLNGRRCSMCRRRKAFEDKIKSLEVKVIHMKGLLIRESIPAIIVNGRSDNSMANNVEPEWLIKLDGMRKNLKSAQRRTYRR